jgi:hypothetical protein
MRLLPVSLPMSVNDTGAGAAVHTVGRLQARVPVRLTSARLGREGLSAPIPCSGRGVFDVPAADFGRLGRWSERVDTGVRELGGFCTVDLKATYRRGLR